MWNMFMCSVHLEKSMFKCYQNLLDLNLQFFLIKFAFEKNFKYILWSKLF